MPRKNLILRLVNRGRGEWWITGLPSHDCPECGPYTTKDEAREDKEGLEKFYRENPSYADWDYKHPKAKQPIRAESPPSRPPGWKPPKPIKLNGGLL